ncbi:MAG: ACT domain-containing protein [Desulfobacteraceae bacterium]|jgi:glycine cleavage system transcriptional repressor
MEKVVLSVLGTDRPGIVAAVSSVLMDYGCNVEDVSQTILQGEFVGIVIASVPDQTPLEDLRQALGRALDPLDLHVMLKSLNASTPPGAGTESEPFVVVTTGPDRLGLVAGITEVMARFEVNITQLKAAFRGGDDPHRNTMIYEVDVPPDTDPQGFRLALRKRAEELGLTLSLQHRDIFEALHRI